MIYSHRVIYNIIGSGKYHNTDYVFKLKSKEFHNLKIGIFSRNYNKMSGYFTGTNRDLWMRNFPKSTILSA